MNQDLERTTGRWLVSAQGRGEVLVVRVEVEGAVLVWAGPQQDANTESVEVILRAAAVFAREATRRERRSLPIPAMLYHLMSRLIAGDVPRRWPASSVAVMLDSAEELGFGILGEAEQQVWVGNSPVQLPWVRLVQKGGGDARAYRLAPDQDVKVRWSWSRKDVEDQGAVIEAGRRTGRAIEIETGTAEAEIETPADSLVAPERPALAQPVAPPMASAPAFAQAADTSAVTPQESNGAIADEPALQKAEPIAHAPAPTRRVVQPPADVERRQESAPKGGRFFRWLDRFIGDPQPAGSEPMPQAPETEAFVERAASPLSEDPFRTQASPAPLQEVPPLQVVTPLQAVAPLQEVAPLSDVTPLEEVAPLQDLSPLQELTPLDTVAEPEAEAHNEPEVEAPEIAHVGPPMLKLAPPPEPLAAAVPAPVAAAPSAPPQLKLAPPPVPIAAPRVEPVAPHPSMIEAPGASHTAPAPAAIHGSSLAVDFVQNQGEVDVTPAPNEPAPLRPVRRAPPRAAMAPLRPRWEDREDDEEAPLWKKPWVIAVAIVVAIIAVFAVLNFTGSRSGGLFGGNSFTLAVTSKPPGAGIVVDGKETTKVTPATLSLSPGHHVIDFTLAGRGKATFEVDGKSQQKATLDAPLFGSLNVEASDPSIPVTISVDGVEKGYAPVTIEELEPGPHEVRFSAPGTAPWSETFELSIGQQFEMVARSMTEPGTGLVSVRGVVIGGGGEEDADGAQVWVDGEPRGITPLKLELSTGPHSFRARYQGEDGPVQVLDLPGGNQRFVQFRFGLGLEMPKLANITPSGPLPGDRPAVVSTFLTGIPENDLAEMWLHVKAPNGNWRRYEMLPLKAPGGIVGTAVFPSIMLDANGQAPHYMSAATRVGDEYFTEIFWQKGARKRPAPAPAPATP